MQRLRKLVFGQLPRGREVETMLTVAALITSATLGGGLLAAVVGSVFRVSQDSVAVAFYGVIVITCLFLIICRHGILPALGASFAAGLFYVSFYTFRPNIVHVTLMTLCYLVFSTPLLRGAKAKKAEVGLASLGKWKAGAAGGPAGKNCKLQN